MDYRRMQEADFDKVISIYMDYYNNQEEGCWTYETVYKRIHPIWSREGSYCMVVEEKGILAGFALGYFEQYDDLTAYDLDEIVIGREYQNQGIGAAFLLELEQRVKKEGAAMVQLKAVNDKMHDHFYGKLQYQDTSNFVLKAKWI